MSPSSPALEHLGPPVGPLLPRAGVAEDHAGDCCVPWRRWQTPSEAEGKQRGEQESCPRTNTVVLTVGALGFACQRLNCVFAITGCVSQCLRFFTSKKRVMKVNVF